MNPTFFSFTQRKTHLDGERPGTRHAVLYNCENKNCEGAYTTDALQQSLNQNSSEDLNSVLQSIYNNGFSSPQFVETKPNSGKGYYTEDEKTFYPVAKTSTPNKYISGFQYSKDGADKSDQYVIVIGNEDEGEKDILNTFDKHYGVPEQNIIRVANPTPAAMEAAYKKVAENSKGTRPKVLVYVGCEGNWFDDGNDPNDFRLWEHDLTHQQTDDQRLNAGTTEAQLKQIHNRYLKDAEVCYLSTSCNSERMFFS